MPPAGLAARRGRVLALPLPEPGSFRSTLRQRPSGCQYPLGRTLLPQYEGEELLHERLLLRHCPGPVKTEFVILTPDEDMYIEDVADCFGSMLCGPGRELPPGVKARSSYRFSSSEGDPADPWYSEEEMAELEAEAVSLLRVERPGSEAAPAAHRLRHKTPDPRAREPEPERAASGSPLGSPRPPFHCLESVQLWIFFRYRSLSAFRRIHLV